MFYVYTHIDVFAGPSVSRNVVKFGAGLDSRRQTASPFLCGSASVVAPRVEIHVRSGLCILPWGGGKYTNGFWSVLHDVSHLYRKKEKK